MKPKLLFALLLAALFLCLCGCGAPVPPAPAGTPSPLEPSAPEVSVAPETPSPDSGGGSGSISGGLEMPSSLEVTDLLSDSGVYTDDVGNVCDYTFRLPHIVGADTEYAGQVNASVDEIYSSYIASAYEAMDGKYSLDILSVDYTVFRGKGALSILITVQSTWDSNYYHTFNFDSDGNELTNPELLEMKGLTEDGFLELARKLMGDMASDGPEDQQLQQLYDMTVAEDNCNADMPMYLDADSGELCFVGTVFVPAGAGQYDYLFNAGV